MQPPPGVPGNRTAHPQGKLRVAVLGNSNSIAHYSYSKYLKQFPGLEIENHSIGDNPNVFLLSYLAANPVVTADAIVVETSVIDAQWVRINRQTEGLVRTGMEQFLTALRRVSGARVVLLVLPTRSVMLEDGPHWVEQMSEDLSHRFGADVLNLYNVVRPMFSHWQHDKTQLENAAKRLMTAAELPVSQSANFLWQTAFQFPGSPLSAFQRYLLADELHASNGLQALVAELLHAWVRHGGGTPPPATPQPHDLVIRVDPEPSLLPRIERGSSLVARVMQPADPSHPVTYITPPGYRPVGVMTNRTVTHAVVRVAGQGGSAGIDLRGGKSPIPFLANIVPIAADIGDGPYTLSVEAAKGPVLPPGCERYWPAEPMDVPPAAEVAEMLLLRRDWADAGALHCPPGTAVEQTPWAAALIADFVRLAETGAASAESAAVLGVRAVVDHAVAGIGTPGMPAGFQKARVSIAMGQFNAAADQLRQATAEAPDDKRAQAALKSLTALRALLRKTS